MKAKKHLIYLRERSEPIIVWCENFVVTTHGGILTGYSIEKMLVGSSLPLYLHIEDIQAVVAA